MFYDSGDQFLQTHTKRVCLIGMSGTGKTHLAKILRAHSWYHYSVDYRIGTRYLGEPIMDEVRKAAMSVPQLADLLRADAVSINMKVGIDRLYALSMYLGKPGVKQRGGLGLEEFRYRQIQHEEAERRATADHHAFITRAQEVYGYDHFICDTSGSFCSVVDPTDASDPLLLDLSRSCLIVHIEAQDDHRQMLVEANRQSPKPIFYSSAFFESQFQAYMQELGASESDVDPDAFAVWAFDRLIDFRMLRYRSIATRWGYSIPANEARRICNPADFLTLVAGAIDTQRRQR